MLRGRSSGSRALNASTGRNSACQARPVLLGVLPRRPGLLAEHQLDPECGRWPLGGVPPPTRLTGLGPEHLFYYRSQTVDTDGVAKARQERTPEQLLVELGPIGVPADGIDGDGLGTAMRAPDLAGTLRPELLDLQRQRSRSSGALQHSTVTHRGPTPSPPTQTEH